MSCHTPLTCPSSLLAQPSPRPIDDGACKTDRPLWVFRRAIDWDSLRRDVECLVKEPLGLREGERAIWKVVTFVSAERHLSEWSAAIGDVHDERHVQRAIAAEERGPRRDSEVPCDV